MPWASDQLPWSNFKYPKPARPSGVFEPLNYMTGPPILIKGVTEGVPGGPPVIHGIGQKPYYPNRTTISYQYNPTIVPGLTAVIKALRIKG